MLRYVAVLVFFDDDDGDEEGGGGDVSMLMNLISHLFLISHLPSFLPSTKYNYPLPSTLPLYSLSLLSLFTLPLYSLYSHPLLLSLISFFYSIQFNSIQTKQNKTFLPPSIKKTKTKPLLLDTPLFSFI